VSQKARALPARPPPQMRIFSLAKVAGFLKIACSQWMMAQGRLESIGTGYGYGELFISINYIDVSD